MLVFDLKFLNKKTTYVFHVQYNIKSGSSSSFYSIKYHPSMNQSNFKTRAEELLIGYSWKCLWHCIETNTTKLHHREKRLYDKHSIRSSLFPILVVQSFLTFKKRSEGHNDVLIGKKFYNIRISNVKWK